MDSFESTRAMWGDLTDFEMSQSRSPDVVVADDEPFQETMEFVLDIQGFRRSSNIFVLKEAALIPVEPDSSPEVLLFEPPCKWARLFHDEQRVNRWLEKNFHGIPWNSGSIPYRDLIKVLQRSLKNAGKIYVKGLEKKKWLEEMLPEKNFYNMDDLRCPSLRNIKKNRQIPVRCDNHRLRKRVCAANNALVLRDWIIERQRQFWTLTDEVDARYKNDILMSMYS